LAEQLEQVLVFGQAGLAEHTVQVLGVVLLHRRSLSRQAARASVDDISPGIASASTQPRGTAISEASRTTPSTMCVRVTLLR
jgi:hypothetical protein